MTTPTTFADKLAELNAKVTSHHRKTDALILYRYRNFFLADHSANIERLARAADDLTKADTDLKRAVARYKAAGNKYVTQ